MGYAELQSLGVGFIFEFLEILLTSRRGYLRDVVLKLVHELAYEHERCLHKPVFEIVHIRLVLEGHRVASPRNQHHHGRSYHCRGPNSLGPFDMERLRPEYLRHCFFCENSQIFKSPKTNLCAFNIFRIYWLKILARASSSKFISIGGYRNFYMVHI